MSWPVRKASIIAGSAATGGFLGLTPTNATPANLVRAAAEGATFALVRLLHRLRALGVKVIARDLAEEGRMVRHSPEALADVLTELVAENHLPDVFAESDDPNRLVPIVTRPERIMIAVAGDPNRTNAYALSNDGPHGWWTAKAIDHTPASDLVCNIGGSCAPGTAS